jgi:hypothetical protein
MVLRAAILEEVEIQARKPEGKCSSIFSVCSTVCEAGRATGIKARPALFSGRELLAGLLPSSFSFLFQ